jgi:hypothetical protein
MGSGYVGSVFVVYTFPRLPAGGEEEEEGIVELGSADSSPFGLVRRFLLGLCRFYVCGIVGFGRCSFGMGTSWRASFRSGSESGLSAWVQVGGDVYGLMKGEKRW